MKPELNDDLKRAVMTRVYTIYLLRKMSEPLFLRIAFFGAFLITFVSMVSIPSVYSNVTSAVRANGSVLPFFKAAFIQSLWVVKFLIVAQAFVVLSFIKDGLSKLVFRSRSLSVVKV